MTDFRARGTIMGPTGLTAVFGMGTGVTPPVWSPERPPGGGQAAPGDFVQSRWSITLARQRLVRRGQSDPPEWTPTAAGSSPEACWGSIARPHWGAIGLR